MCWVTSSACGWINPAANRLKNTFLFFGQLPARTFLGVTLTQREKNSFKVISSVSKNSSEEK